MPSAARPPAWQPAVPSYKVRNLGSTVLDHMVYWSNVAEFITAVIYDVTRGVAQMPFSRQILLDQLGSAIRQRHWRVGLLVFTRWIYFVTAGALFIVWFGSLVAIGSSIFDGAADVFDLEVLQTDYRWLRSAVGAALFGAGAAAGWYLLVKLWSLLMAADESRWFRNHSAPIGTAAVRAWLVALAIVALACFGWLWTVDAVAALLYLVTLGLGGGVLRVLSQGGQQRTEKSEPRPHGHDGPG